jgi:hypothetical protein
MQKPPYLGQGTPLDKATKLTGEWVMKNHVFLFQPPPDEMMTAIKISPRQRCAGINVEQLAPMLQASVAEVFAANRARTLATDWKEIPPTAKSADRTIRYFFMMPSGAGAYADFHLAQIRGNA